jgi:hypothetical protein
VCLFADAHPKKPGGARKKASARIEKSRLRAFNLAGIQGIENRAG